LASIVLEDVTVDFPVYGSHRSWRKDLLGGTAGGLIRRDGNNKGHVVVRALDDINLEISDGDKLGLIGHNGAGKSTLLRVLAGVYAPSSGDITIAGHVSPLFASAPGLDIDDTGFENIITCGLFLGMSRQEIARKTPEIESVSQLGQYLSLPVRTYSTGMMVRLGFAIATSLDPEILLLDEGLSAGDAQFTERMTHRVKALIERSSILVLASHSDALIKDMCNKAVLLEQGRVVAAGTVDEVLQRYHAGPPTPPASPAG
jgi:ABC-type polysaccharide/polyol phosphate transport system ATPase subunit